MSDIYDRLRDKLNQLAKGLPRTKTGAEMDFIREWFTPEEAEIFLTIQEGYVTPQEYSLQIGMDVKEAAEKLEAMAQKGLLFRVRQGGAVKYHSIPVIHGIFEFRIKEFDFLSMKKFVGKISAAGLTNSLGDTSVPFYRTVPVNVNLLNDGSKILPVDDAVSMVKSKKVIAVTDCACRKAMQLINNPCKAAGNRLETCLCFDDWADYYVENKLGRYITTEEALDILARNEQDGLVTQVANSQKVEIICSCCACCCGFMYVLRVNNAECRENNSNYMCLYDAKLCRQCGKCIERCSLGALKMEDGKLAFNNRACMGCGLCVSTCPQQARSLVKKPEEDIYNPPETLFDAYHDMEKDRRKSGRI